MKGISALIASVFIIAISVTGVAIVLTAGLPAIDRARDSAVVGEATQNMQILDNLVRQVASEGVGALRTFDIRVSDGEYRISPAGTLDFAYELKTDLLPRGIFRQEGSLLTSVVGSAAASQNSTHMILENEILEVVQPRVGSETSFAGINTTTAISSIRLKDGGPTITPLDVRVIVGNVTNTSWGLGYSKLALEGSEIPAAESIFHVKSNLTGTEYDVVYTLRASSDFLLINVRNVSTANLTTIVFSYRIGSSAAEFIKIGNGTELIFSTTDIFNNNATLNLDNTNSSANSSSIIVNVSTSNVFYNASDNTWRNVSELAQIGQGNWSSSNNATHTTLNFELAGSDGWDFGIRDDLAGGSYWLDQNGNSLESDLVGYWQFSEGRGTFSKDSSGYSHDATWTNPSSNATWITNSSCRVGNCLSFDGSNDFVFLGTNNPSVTAMSSINGAYNLTVTAWIRTPASFDSATGDLQGTNVIFGKNGPVFLSLDGNKVRGALYTGSWQSIAGSTSLSANTWYMLSVVYDGASIKVYVNGVQDGSTAQSGAFTVGNGCAQIGRYTNGECDGNPLNYFKGYIDEIRLYNRVMTSGELKRIYDLSTISLQNDFLSYSADPYTHLNLTNYTSGSIFSQATESIIVDNYPLTANYSVNGTRVYFFDWKEMAWKVWMKNTDNATHGTPDWLDPRFKQEFKWKQEFKRAGLPSINITYLMTAHDPFVRTFVDTGPLGYASTVDNSTVGYWQFNEGDGSTTRDETGNGNSGTLNLAGWTTNSSCKIGNCLGFNGTDSNVTIADNGDFTIPADGLFSQFAWINTRSTDSDRIIISAYDGSTQYYGMSVNSGDLQVSMRDENSNSITVNTNVPVNDGNWHHVGWTKDGSTVAIYVDGSRVSSTTDTTDSAINPPNGLVIGRCHGTCSHFSGFIDEVRIWDRSLTAGEVNEEYQRGVSHNITIPVSFGQQKTYYQAYEDGGSSWKPNQDPPTTFNWFIYNTSGRSLYRVDGGAPNLAATNYLAKPMFTFHDKTSNDNVLLVTSAWQAGSGKHRDFEVSWNDSDANGKWDKTIFKYNFNATSNNNFLFTLGHGVSTTSSWTATITPYTCDSTTFCGTQAGFGGETFMDLGNSSLTYYDLKDSSIAAWWKLNEGSGSIAYDSSGNNNTGTLNANTTWSVGNECKPGFGYCLQFNGSRNFVNVSSSPTVDVTGKHATIMAWVKLQQRSGHILAKNYGDGVGKYSLSYDPNQIRWDGIFCYDVNNCARASVGATPDLNRWYHVAAVFNSGKTDLYIDGVYQSSGTMTQDQILSSSHPLYIGAYQAAGGPTSFINGSVDNVKIYSRSFSVEEIKADYLATADDYPNFGKTNQTGGATSMPAVSFNYDGGAAAIWKLDEGSGTNVTDSSGNGNVGTLGNRTSTTSKPTWITNTSCKIGSCLKFDGTDDIINISSQVYSISDGTFEAWIFKTGSGTSTNNVITGSIIGSNRAPTIYVSSGTLRWEFGTASTKNTGQTINDNQWYHIVLTYTNGRYARIYLNGLQVDSATSTAITDFLDYVVVGGYGRNTNAEQYFEGLIDEVKIYGRALSEKEILEHYQFGTGKYYDDFGTAATGKTYRFVGVEDSNTVLQPITPNATVLHLRFNDNSTLNVTDVSGLGNNGRTGSNATWLTNSSCKEWFGGCTFFNGGTNSHVYIPYNTTHDVGAGDFTLSAWVLTKNSACRCGIISNKNGGGETGYFFGTRETTNRLMLWYDTDAGGESFEEATDGVLLTDRWYHVTFTRKGSTGTFYINGTQIQQVTVSGLVNRTGLPLIVGSLRSNSNNWNGTIDEVLVINRSLTANEVYELYLGGINRTVNGKWHRVASADDLNSVAFNLTDKNNTLTTQDYDMRMILFNGTTTNSTNPVPQCYTGSSLTSKYVCSYDSQQFSPAKASGLIYSGEASLFSSICNDEVAGQYRFNLTTVGPSQAILPFTNAVCTDIGNKTGIIENQGIPSTVLGSVDVRGTSRLFMSLSYDRIKIDGAGRIGQGSHRLCIERNGTEVDRAVVTVRVC